MRVDVEGDTVAMDHHQRHEEDVDDGDRLPGRYEKMDLLGAGGMGQVWLCRDDIIGRRVALKVLQGDLAGDKNAAERFVLEARVQGRLEHPSVVPVYDMGADDQDAPFFTMKRVQGVTLEQVLREQREEEGTPYTQRRLLTAFSQVCLAVDYAHRQGVLHRDIKPANIMLGDYGEVYVLDWGLAKIGPQDTTTAPPTGDEHAIDTDDLAASIAGGELQGTPAYMSVEQMKNLSQASEPPADVYSLGAVLFEILTLAPLNTGKALYEILSNTLLGLDARPSVRAPQRQIPVELERICVRATTNDPGERFPTARALHQAVEAFLDGERNEELRRELAAKHASSAAEAIERATAGQGLPMDQRRDAMGSIGRALALDPRNAQALDAMTWLLTQAPDELPAEVDEGLQRTFDAQWAWSGRVAGVAYLSMVLYLPLFFWSGIRSVPAVAVFFGLALFSCVMSFVVGLTKSPKISMVMVTMCSSTLCFASTMTLFGPLFVTPGLIASNTAAYVMLLRGWHRAATIGFGCLSMGAVILLEGLGIPWSAYVFTDAGMILKQGALGLPVAPTIALLTFAALSTVVTTSLSVSRLRDALTRAERRLQLHSWQIHQLVPAFRDGEEESEQSVCGPLSCGSSTGDGRSPKTKC